jgi:hypothetical protein
VARAAVGMHRRSVLLLAGARLETIGINAAGFELMGSQRFRRTVALVAAHILGDVYFALLDKTHFKA